MKVRAFQEAGQATGAAAEATQALEAATAVPRTVEPLAAARADLSQADAEVEGDHEVDEAIVVEDEAAAVHDMGIPTLLTRIALYRYVLLCSFG